MLLLALEGQYAKRDDLRYLAVYGGVLRRTKRQQGTARGARVTCQFSGRHHRGAACPAHGFDRALIAGLLHQGLATVQREVVSSIEMVRIKIADVGRTGSKVDRTQRNAASGGGVDLLREAASRAPHAALALPTDTRHQKGRGFASRIEGTCLAGDTCRMAKKPEPLKADQLERLQDWQQDRLVGRG
jgi:hypothetical protein